VAQQQPGAGLVQMLGGRMQHEADVTVIPMGIIVLLGAAGFGLFLTGPTLLQPIRQAPSGSQPAPVPDTSANPQVSTLAPRAQVKAKVSGALAAGVRFARMKPKVAGAAAAAILGLIVLIGALVFSGGPSGPDWLEGTFHHASGNPMVVDVGGRRIRVSDSHEGSQTYKILSVSYPQPGVAEMDLQRGSETRRIRFTRTADGVRTQEQRTPSGSWRDETTFHR
jgi:hypothetical protein